MLEWVAISFPEKDTTTCQLSQDGLRPIHTFFSDSKNPVSSMLSSLPSGSLVFSGPSRSDAVLHERNSPFTQLRAPKFSKNKVADMTAHIQK